MKKLALLLSLYAVPVVAQENPCAGRLDETTSIQAAVTAGSPINFEPRLYCVNARLGIRIPGFRDLNLNGATIGVLPGCSQHCKAFETIPGAEYVTINGPGLVLGDMVDGLPEVNRGFSIGLRIDSARNVEVSGVTFRQWRWDGIWVGGNAGSHNVYLDKVLVEGYARNGLSIVNGSFVTVSRYTARNASPVALVGAGIDVEPNPPSDQVTHVTITDSLVENSIVGYYLHAGRSPLQSYGIRLLNSIARNNTRYGIILNSTRHAFILDNQVFAPAAVVGQPLPAGISVGASFGSTAGPILAEDVTIAGNRVEGTSRSAILAGVRDTRVIGNVWVGGSLLTVQPSPTVPATSGVQFYVP